MVRVHGEGNKTKEYVSNKAEIYAKSAYICIKCNMIIAHIVDEWLITKNIIPKEKNISRCVVCNTNTVIVKKGSSEYYSAKANSKGSLCYG